MYTNQYKFKYLEWHSPAEIHQRTLKWQSELDFLQNEQTFLHELLGTYRMDILNQKNIEVTQSLLKKLTTIEKEIPLLTRLVREHRSALVLLVDEIDEVQKEKAFKDRHLLLELKIDDYLEAYRSLKNDIFSMVSTVIKKKKQKQLLK